MSLRVLIVDDSILFRKSITDAVSGIPDAEIVGTAANGKIALSRIKILKPDIVTLDLEMPEMNGLELLEAIRDEGIVVCVVLLSCLTVRGGDLTMKGLELGAFDYIAKPEGATPAENTAIIRRSLEPIFKAFKGQKDIRGILRGKPTAAPPPRFRIPAGAPASLSTSAPTGKRSEAIAIGISTGGPKALTDVMIALPGNLGVPLFVVQHMPAFFTASLANNLNSRCAFRVKEAENGEAVHANTAYIAPGGKQMRVALATDGTGKVIRITDDPPENNCRPSVDHLFRSIAHHYMGRATGVIMTGMGNDGVVGLKLMKRNGALVIAQNEATCVVYGMPKAAVDAGVVDLIVPLERIAGEIMKSLGAA
jgi:two-component system, chemotaxis family, protein-glutamate methylesterase/glutaminase